MNARIHFFTLTLSLTLLQGILYANPSSGAEEFEREYSDRFDVRPDVELSINTSFADVVLTPSEDNMVTIDIEVRLQARNKEAAEKKFDKLSIKMDGSPRRVDVAAELQGNWNSPKDELEIIVNITAPVNSILTSETEFGSFTSGLFGNKSSVRAEFGKLDCEGFTHSEVDIVSTYSSGRIRRFHGGKINVEFGSLTIEQLNGSTDISNSYGSIEIRGITSQTESIAVDNEFGSVSLELESDASFRIEGESSFGKIELPMNARVERLEKDITATEVEAVLGEEPSGEITIDTSFGDVTIDPQ